MTLISKSEGNPNIVPLSAKLPGYFLTPSTAYLRISAGSKQSFLLESVIGNQQIARYSWIGSDPIHVIETGPNCAIKADPITELERVLSGYRTVSGTELPFTGLPPSELVAYKQAVPSVTFHTNACITSNPKQPGKLKTTLESLKQSLCSTIPSSPSITSAKLSQSLAMP